MPTSKQVLQLEYEQCLEALKQFEEKFPEVRARSDYLGITIANVESGSVLKLTVTQAGEAAFVKATKLPKEFEVKLGARKALLKIVIGAAPILTSVAPKSGHRRPASPVPAAAPAPLDLSAET
jgi:hypothetical protein